MRTTLCILALGLAVSTATSAPAATLYVDQDALGANDGSSWEDAWVDLQDALRVAAAGDQIWIAEGVYRPTTTLQRAVEFRVAPGVQLYGGFVGTETFLEERDPSVHRTVLSGDIGERRPMGEKWDPAASWAQDNSLRLVLLNAAGAGTILDGLEFSESGRALDIYGGAPLIRNSVVRWNHGSGQGIGALVRYRSSASFEDVSFERNISAMRSGGGVASDAGSTPSFVRVLFRGNAAALQGGGMSGTGTFTDVRFVSNHATLGGGLAGGGHLVNVSFEYNDGGMYGGGLWSAGGVFAQNVSFVGNAADHGAAFHLGQTPGVAVPAMPASIFVNATIADNPAAAGASIECAAADLHLVSTVIADQAMATATAPIQFSDATVTVSHSLVRGSGGSGAWNPAFGTNLGGNLDADPGYAGTGDFRLAPGAPGIDAGDSDALAPGTETDLDGNPRIAGPCVDMGAWELQAEDEPDDPASPFAARITPRALNLGSNGRFVSLSLWSVGSTPVEEIDVTSLRLQGVVAPEDDRARVEDDTLRVKFDRAALAALLEPAPTATIEISGALLDGSAFAATDEIKLVGQSVAAAGGKVQAFPNPFNPATSIRFELDRSMRVELAIFDLSGRRVRTLVSGTLPAGAHAEQWNGTDANGRGVATGTYFARLSTEEFQTVGKLVLVK
jgi:hypothetical protein